MSRIATPQPAESQTSHFDTCDSSDFRFVDTIPTPVADTSTGLRKMLRAWYRPFVMAHRIPVVKRVWLWVAAMAVYSFLVYEIADKIPAGLFKDFGTVGGSTGIILGLLLVFRTNSAYERWWEGRKLWGQLINDSRNLCLQVRSLDTILPSDRKRFGELIISFAYALKHHLRGTAPSTPLPGVGRPSEADAKHLPLFVAGKIYDMLAVWQRDQQIDGFTSYTMSTIVMSFINICGSCERIKNSPIAISYRAFMRQGIALNLFFLPWYMSQQFSLGWSMPLVLISTYFLIGIELIAEDVEDPFGYDGDDLPLDNLCATLRNNVSRIMKVENNSMFTQSIALPRLDILKNT